MAETAIVPMTADAFFAWQQAQSDAYELVDRFPVRMMTDARNRHDQITVNLIVETGYRLRGKPCRPATQDTGIKVSDKQVRRADVLIDCGPIVDKAFFASDPRVVFEVLSPSTRSFDVAKKLEEYKSLASIRHILLIDPDNPEIIDFQRGADATWTSRTHRGVDAEIDFSDLGFSLTLADVYRGLTFRPRPTLVSE